MPCWEVAQLTVLLRNFITITISRTGTCLETAVARQTLLVATSGRATRPAQGQSCERFFESDPRRRPNGVKPTPATLGGTGRWAGVDETH